MDGRNRSNRRQDRKAISLTAAKLSCYQFYKKIESDSIENIFSVKEAYKSKRFKQCIIVGKVAKLPSKLPNAIRRDLKNRCGPATFIVMREVSVAVSDETVTYGRLYKVKFAGAIAKEILESDIKVGDRIALKNLTAIEENTEYCPCARYSSLTLLALDGSETTVIIGKKVLQELRCNTPDSEDQNVNLLPENDRTEIEERDSPAPTSSRLCSNNKRRFNNDSPPPSTQASPARNNNKTPIKMKKMRVNSPPKPPLHVALEEIVAEESNQGNTASSSLSNISQVSKYTKLKDIDESLVNSKVDIFGIVIDVLQSRENGKSRKMLRLRIIDSSIPVHKAFEILVFYSDEKPKICKRWIVRLKNVKIEAIREEVNGRIFSPGCLICFPTEKGMPKFVTSRKKPYNYSDDDKQVVKSLKAFLANQKSWNILTLPNSYYADKQAGSYAPYLKLEEITGDIPFFSLKCKIVSFKIFLEVKMAFLTVEDTTVCHFRTYQFPKTAKSWSAVVQNEEVYCEDSTKIDILLKNFSHTCDSDVLNLLMQTGVYVDISEIQTRKMISGNNSGLMFIVDVEKTKISQIEELPSTSQVENPPPRENRNEEQDSDDSGMRISEYNALLAECRDEPMTPTTAKLLAPIPEKKKEIKKRRKLVPTNLGMNVLLDISTEDVNASADNDQNAPMACNEQVENQSMTLGKSKSNYSSKLQSKHKENCDKSKKSPKNTQTSPAETINLPIVSVHKLTEDEIIKISSTSSPDNTKKSDRQSPKQQKSPIGKKKTIGPKSKDDETRSPTSRPCASSNAVSREEIVIDIDAAPSCSSKQIETCFGEENEQLPVSQLLENSNNEVIDVDNPRSSYNEGTLSVEEIDRTDLEMESIEECSLIENCEEPANAPRSKSRNKSTLPSVKKPVTSSDVKFGLRNHSLARNHRSIENLFSTKSPSVLSGSSRESNTGRKKDRTVATSSNSSPSKIVNSPKSNTQDTSKCNKTPETPSPTLLNTPKAVLNTNRDSPGAVLDMDKSILGNDGSDDIFNPRNHASEVKKVYSKKMSNSPAASFRLQCEGQVDANSGASSSQTQFTPVVSSNVRKENIGDEIANVDVHQSIAQANRLSPCPSIVTEKYFPSCDRLKCTKKLLPQKRKRVELLLSPPVFSSPGSIVTEKYNFTGKRVMCTKRKKPLNSNFLQPLNESANTSFCLEKWLQQVDSEIVLDESLAPDPVVESVMHECQNLEESENLAEFMTLRENANSPPYGKKISDSAMIINSEPSILDKPLEIVSGYCKEPCNAFFRYSVLEFNADSNPICPCCSRTGKSIEVELVFLFKLNLMLHKNQNVRYPTLVHFNQAVKFLGCTVEEYLLDEGLRSRVVNNLSEHFFLKGKTSSPTYSPSLHVNLRVTNDDGSAPGTVHLVDTVLPQPAASPPIQLL